MAEFASTVDVLEIVVGSCGLRNPAAALQMRGVSRAWYSAVSNVVRQLARDEDQSWNGATRLCAWAAKLPKVARLCVVAGGAEWLQELPQTVIKAPPGSRRVPASVIIDVLRRMPLLTTMQLGLSLSAEDTQTLFTAMPELCQHLQRLDLVGASFAFDDSADIVAAAIPPTVVSIDFEASINETQGGDRFAEALLTAHGPRLQELRLCKLSATGKGNGVGQKTADLIGAVCPKLRRLDLTTGEEIDWAGLVVQLPLLKDASFSSKSGVVFDDEVLRSIGAHCPQLQRLYVGSWSHTITGAGLLHIARGCPDFRELHMYCKDVTGADIVRFASQCPELRKLDVDGLSDSAPLAGLGRAAPKLEHVHLLGLRQPLPAGFCDELPNLQSLVLGGSAQFTHEMAVAVGTKCPNLRTFDAARQDFVKDASLVAIARGCPELRNLNVTNGSAAAAGAITDAGIIAIAQNCPRLECINVTGRLAVTDAAMRAIGRHCSRIWSIQWTTKKRGGTITDDLPPSIVGGLE